MFVMKMILNQPKPSKKKLALVHLAEPISIRLKAVTRCGVLNVTLDLVGGLV